MEEADKPRSRLASTDELQRRRRDIDRGLRRNHFAVLAASVMVGLFALAALWLSGEARHRAEDARLAQWRAEASAAEALKASTRLRGAAARLAHLVRFSGKPGQRTEALQAIDEAMEWQPSRELRDEALSALLLPDVGTNLIWHKEAGFEVAGAYDANFERFILNNDRGRAIVRRTADGAELMNEPGLGPGTSFWQFSPDGRLAALAFSGGQIGVWDWRQTNLVAHFSSIEAAFAEPLLDFSPDGGHLWLLASTNCLRRYTVETGQPGISLAPGHPARSVRLSPSGKFAALACSNILEVWDLSSHTQRSTVALTNEIWRMAWQPGEERLAIGCYGGLFLWDIGTENAAVLETGDLAITSVMFTADGSLLLSGGWSNLGEIWDVRQRQRVLGGGFDRAEQLNRDQNRIATFQEKVGFGIREFFPPLGVRTWSAPPLLGENRYGADVDPQGRWVLMARSQGWFLRDTASGQELARARCELVGSVSFSGDGSNVLAWSSDGLARWPLKVERDGSMAVLPRHVFSWPVPHGWNNSCFSADGRFTALAVEGRVTVFNTDDPTQHIQISLRRPGDNSMYLSPDGAWLIAGHHNQHGLDWYDTRAGQFIRTFAEEGLAGPSFDPQTGALFTCTATGHTKWNLETGQPEWSRLWRIAFSYQGFLSFAPDGRLALVKVTPSRFHLYDLQAGRDFATLELGNALAVFGGHWSRDGHHIFLFGNDGGITRVDLPPLRRELEQLGLNWTDDNPSRDFPEAQATAKNTPPAQAPALAEASPTAFGLFQPAKLAWLVSAGLLVTIGIGLYILRYQRRLFSNYLETEDLVARREAELREAQAALLLSEKMKALGTMAAGMAHDFNNLLSVVRLSSELIEERTQPDGVTRENFETIQQAVQRGKGIVNSMLGYARDDGQVRKFAANDLVSEAVALLSKPFLSGLVLEIEVQRPTSALIGRKGRVEQMLLNLILNAAEAMGGRGALRLAAREVSEASGWVLPPRPARSYVEISVADSGPGIAPEVLPRIFEPFFTTKTKGTQHGTGLGLSMLYTMAREDGIGVAVASEPGRGTTFRLFLPVDLAATDSATANGGPGAAASPAGATRPLPDDGQTAQIGRQHG